MQAAKATQFKIEDTLEQVIKYVSRKSAALSPARPSATSTQDIKEISKLTLLIQNPDVIDSFSPKSQKTFKKECKRKRKALM